MKRDKERDNNSVERDERKKKMKRDKERDNNERNGIFGNVIFFN